MTLARYTEKLRNLAESYFREENILSTTQRCCISLDEQVLSIVVLDQHKEINDILLLDNLRFDDIKSLPLVLHGMVEKFKLTQTPVYWLLGPNDYQLNLIESMPVPKNEFLTALTWRIRSLITYPMDEAVMEYFELPAKKNAPNAPLIAAVTAQKTNLYSTISLFKECGLSMVKIDIPELAMSNLSALYENDERSTAFLYFYEKFIILNISNRKTLYFTRRINLAFTSENVIDFEKLSLEILRYFDFFRSQWRLSSPVRIFIASATGDMQSASKTLSERLMNQVEIYKLNATVLDEKNKAEISLKYLLDYGCILKQGSMDASTGN